MTNLSNIRPITNKITNEYDLCDDCLGRLFSKQLKLSSNKLLGKKLKKNKTKSSKCYICKNLLSNLPYYLKLMFDASTKYDFTSFVVGAIIKPSLTDRDDFIRSKFKLKGIDSIKTSITKELGKQFARKTKAIFDYLDPDITFTINFKDDFCHVRSKSISLFGRYTKSQRTIPQKQKSCSNCNGKGCRICNFHGISEFDSVEGKLSEYLFKKFGGTTVKFTWIGGEDTSSLVSGSGRPFFARIQNPSKRNPRLSMKVKSGPITILNCKIIPTIPKKPTKFTSLIDIRISSKNPINSKTLKKLRNLLSNPVVIYEKSGKRSEKSIFGLKYRKNTSHKFTLIIKTEGGFPVKRFVDGDDVSPNITQIMNTNCICDTFDFLEIDLK